MNNDKNDPALRRQLPVEDVARSMEADVASKFNWMPWPRKPLSGKSKQGSRHGNRVGRGRTRNKRSAGWE